METPERDEAGLVVGRMARPFAQQVPIGVVLLALVVGGIGGWAMKGGESSPPVSETPPVTIDYVQLASCRRAITAARQGFGYAVDVLDSTETAMTAAGAGNALLLEEARSRIRGTTASILDIAPGFNAAAAAC